MAGAMIAMVVPMAAMPVANKRFIFVLPVSIEKRFPTSLAMGSIIRLGIRHAKFFLPF
jgi:hypothetical protein